jgi:hypothetical protein
MATEPEIECSEYAIHRMSQRGIQEHHVWYCIVHHKDQYNVGGKELVYECKLPDGRNIKVRVRDGSKNPIYVIDAFVFK